MRSTSAALLLAATVLGVTVGCRDLTAPVPMGSRFVLVKVGDSTLPTITSYAPSGWTEVADTIVFVGEASAASGTVEHHESGFLPGQSPVSMSYERLYDWDGRVLRFHPPPCPPNALCVRAIDETGVLVDGHLTITYGDSLALPRTYRRIS